MPNYGLLQRLPDLVPVDPAASILKGLQTGQQIHQNQQMGALRDLQMKQAQEDLKFTPQMHQMQLAQAQQGLDKGAIELQNLPEKERLETAGKRSSLATQALQQNHLKIQTAIENIKGLNSMLGSISQASADKQPEMYQAIRNQAASSGLNVSAMPEKWGPDAQAFSLNAYAQSGQALKALDMKKKQLDILNSEKKLQGSNNPSYDKAAATDFIKYQADGIKAAQSASKSISVLNSPKADIKNMKTLSTGMATGFAAGRFTDAGRKFRKDAALLNVEMIPIIKGHITNNQLQFIQSANPSEYNTPKVNLEIIAQREAAANRASEFPAFISALKKRGIRDSAVAQAPWNKYGEDKPFLDPNTGKPAKKNLGSWHSYVSPRAIQMAQDGILNEMAAAAQNIPPPVSLPAPVPMQAPPGMLPQQPQQPSTGVVNGPGNSQTHIPSMEEYAQALRAGNPNENISDQEIQQRYQAIFGGQ